MGNCGCGTNTINGNFPNKPYNDSFNYNNLRNKPEINGTPLSGKLTSVDLGLYGEGNPETFSCTQTVPSDKWTIKHNLNKFPSVTIVDSAGSVVVGDIVYVDESTVEVYFTGAFSGKCYLN